MPLGPVLDATGARAGQSCPIVPDLMDRTAGRIAAFLAMAVLAVAAWLGWSVAVLALAGDFALRALGHPTLSPLARVAGFLRRLFNLSERKVNAGPKRFAASVGFLFTLGVGLALLAGFRSLGFGLAIVLGACAGLEAFFGFCLACQIHPWLPWIRVRAVR